MPDNDTTHPCPAPRCTLRVRHDQFACPADWVRLPDVLRRAITEARRRGWTQWTDTAVKAVAWYREHDQTVDSLERTVPCPR